VKTAAIVLLVVGLLMTLYSGFTYVTKEKVVDLGSVQITRDKEHAVDWQPYVGIGVMIAGGALLAVRRRRILAV
jgi:LPXTG-motif cell wall-anchored protein